ncbi:Cna protein B-type domain [Seminavis robusta]|uniref:Cna protein B-type domain n=1 Tax=Seminavis robusta TaxID=568900 RepID=A0A9N8E6Q0_9STRA|nr:Cna protein B-type domain [Seminavis robusta]|eukprot:Sro602_g173760.1 Cna protein B-type domain (734) ;mRNA; r:40052-42431
MKISFVPLLVLSIGATAARKLHENKAVLSNGAEFLIDIQSPDLDSTIDLAADENTASLSVTGKAQVGPADARVAYLFIVDSSGTNNNESVAECGTISDCTTEFFRSLHGEVTADGSAEAIGVINFNSSAISVTEFQDPDNVAIEEALHGGPLDHAGGEASCMTALETAASMIYDSSPWAAETIVVVFAGDGVCHGTGSSNTTLLPLLPDQGADTNTQEKSVAVSAGVLGRTYAMVHSVALGGSRDCDGDNSFAETPRNGGSCHSLSDPTTPLGIVHDITATELTSLEIAIDDEYYRPLRSLGEIQVQLPLEGPVQVDFEVQAKDLARGSHDICVRASGKSPSGYLTFVEDCHRATIATPHFWPSSSDSVDSPTCTVDHELAQTTREITVDVGYNDVESGNFAITIYDPPYAAAGSPITTSGFCVDVGRSIQKGQQYKMDVFSAFDPDIHTNAIDKPQYLPHLAWLVNNYEAGDTYPATPDCSGGEITWREMQGAVWKLVDDDVMFRASSRVECIAEGIAQDARDNGGNYEPDCLNRDERIPLVMVVDDDATGEILNQVIISQTFLSTIEGMCNCTTKGSNPAAIVIGATSGVGSLSGHTEMVPGATTATSGTTGSSPATAAQGATGSTSGPTGSSPVKTTMSSVTSTKPKAGVTSSSKLSKEIYLPVLASIALLLVAALAALKNRRPNKDEASDTDSTDSRDSDSAGWDSGSNGWDFDDPSVGSSVGEVVEIV